MNNPVDPTTVTRREFLKSSAIAIPVIASPLAVARTAYARGSDTIKVGLVGCGGRGTGAAGQALRADAGAVLWAAGDVFKDRLEGSLKGLAEEFGDKAKDKIHVGADRQFTGFDAYKQVIDSGVDAVVLTSYPNFRPAHARYAIEKGKHVFAEKPVAVDAVGLQEFLRIGEAAKSKNLAMCIGFCWRYHPGMRDTFAQINSGAIGDVVSVHTNYHTGTLPKRKREDKWSDLEFQMRNWWHFNWISGDHIVEQAVHSVDRLSWAVGDMLPVRVQALGGRAARSGPEHGDVFDHFTAIYEYQSGLRTHHTCRQIDQCPSDNSDYIYGTKGRAQVNGFNNIFKIWDRDGKETFSSKPKGGDMYQIEHNELFKSIRDGKPINDCPRAVYSCMQAVMGRMAAYTGQTVTFEHMLKSQENLQPASLSWDMTPPAPVVAIPGKTKLV